jgi:hypothetical protein
VLVGRGANVFGMLRRRADGIIPQNMKRLVSSIGSAIKASEPDEPGRNMWFRTLVRKLLRRASFAFINDLNAKVLAFVEYFNKTMAKPFIYRILLRDLF